MANFFGIESPFVAHCSIEAGERLPDGVRARVLLRPELMNSLGGAHGGLIATLLDATMTAAARYELDPEGRQGAATIDLSVTFIGQAKKEVVCEGKVTARRGSTLYLEAQARDEDGEVVARGIATFRAVGR